MRNENPTILTQRIMLRDTSTTAATPTNRAPPTAEDASLALLALFLVACKRLLKSVSVRRSVTRFFCPRRKRQGLCDGRVRVVCCWRSLFVYNHAYLWNLHLDFDV